MSRRMTRDPKFAAIYSEHAAHVWRLARHFGVPPEQLHDVAQEVWVSVFRQLESLDLSRPLKPWLTAVVWNHVRHLRRGYARHMRKAQALTDAEAVRGGGEEPMSRSEAVWTLERLLSELPADQREVLLLCDGEGLSAPEVSEALGAPLNTVYSRLRLARRRCQAFAATLGAAGWALLIQRHCVEQGPSPGELEGLSTALGSPMASVPAAVGAATGPRSWLGAAALVASVVAAGALAAGLWQMHDSREAAAAEPAAKVEAAPPEEVLIRGAIDEVPSGAAVGAASGDARVVPEAGAASGDAGVVPQAVGEAGAVIEEVAPAVVPAPAPRRAARRSAPAPVSPAPPVEEVAASRRNSLAAEHRILDEAKAALAAGNTSLALSLLDEHRRDFPRSPSADIRDLMRVRIHCGKGNAAAAKAVAEQYPGDPQFSALMRRCD
ncbi:sigma-70 family RNA polymerase sigma factor [Nannocystis sp. ILAH1]|uniref:RNA polymerase sigma factor n=1 Tax=Nannocystis sp. ILAH1 TaxID=2996789 RepID=UPI00226D44A5|nr:sigma-70 family RNA polymerase sigma factor [Nannocystis sp. ILAH1]MCY0987166.1 sigma-70 family RNA polymerase sigma factor [Nannocystis sp. ILAH1]